MKDEQIIALFFARSEEAISALWEKYGSYCHTIAHNILQTDEDAEECVSDAFLAAWNAIPPQKPKNLAAFLGKITRNKALSRYRQNTAERRGFGQTALALSELEECVSGDSRVEEIIDRMAVTDTIRRFLKSLPTMKRQIFLQRYWYFCSTREIAGFHGISESKTSTILHRMRKQLKTQLEKEGILL